jgi:hypothetical protein
MENVEQHRHVGERIARQCNGKTPGRTPRQSVQSSLVLVLTHSGGVPCNRFAGSPGSS